MAPEDLKRKSVGHGDVGTATLLVVAAPAEALAVAGAFGAPPPAGPWELRRLTGGDRGGEFDLVVSGVGKANAAGATARFADAARHGCVLSVGIAGALPGSGLTLGEVVAAGACVYSDEGIETPDGFLDCGQMGFPLGDFAGREVPVDARVLSWLGGLVGEAGGRVGRIATVSTCSGTDELARRVVERTAAIAEAMEGAAVVQVARRLGLAGGEVRAVSNTTGDRARQVWKIRAALDSLSAVLGRMADRV